MQWPARHLFGFAVIPDAVSAVVHAVMVVMIVVTGQMKKTAQQL